MRTSLLASAALIWATLALAAHAAEWRATTVAVQQPSDTADRRSIAAALTPDGLRALFRSEATDLVPGASDTGSCDDVFVHDALTDAVELISRWEGEPLAAACGTPAGISDDGRYVLYTSPNASLDRDHVRIPGRTQVYLHDRVSDTARLVSHATDQPEQPVNRQSQAIAISGDGRWILFLSAGTDVVPGFVVGALGTEQLYLYDRIRSESHLVSHINGAEAKGCSNHVRWAVMSADARRIAFTSRCHLFGSGSGFWPREQVWLYDREERTSQLASHRYGLHQEGGNGDSYIVGLSSDGATLVYSTLATDTIASWFNGTDVNGTARDVFIHEAGATGNRLVSRSTAATLRTANRGTTSARMSGDGRYLLLETAATDLVGMAQDPANVDSDVFRFDVHTGEMNLVSHTRGDTAAPASAPSSLSWISGDGSQAIFRSYSTDLAEDLVYPDTLVAQAFHYDFATRRATLLSHRHRRPREAAELDWYALSATPDARRVLFHSASTDLIPDAVDANGAHDVFVLERAGSTVELLSGARASVPGPRTPNWRLATDAVSDDGRYFLSHGSSSNFLSRLGNRTNTAYYDDEYWNIFLHDREGGGVMLVNHVETASHVTTSGSQPPPARMSRDGRFVAFDAPGSAISLVGTGDSQVFLFDREQGRHRLVSRVAGSASPSPTGTSYSSSVGGDTPQAVYPGAPSRLSGLSGDGRRVLYSSSAKGLVTGFVDPTGVYNAYVYDRISDSTELVSRPSGLPDRLPNGQSIPRAISDDGTWVLFHSEATNLVTDTTDANGTRAHVFLRNLLDGSVTLVSKAHATLSSSADGTSRALALSDDGRYAVFSSDATNLVSGADSGAGAPLDIYLHDRVAGTNQTLSLSAYSPADPLPRASSFAQFSRDGRYVLFRTAASQVVPGFADANGAMDVFLYDRFDNRIHAISRDAQGRAPAVGSDQPIMSDDARFIAFRTAAEGMVAGIIDENASDDVFVHDRAQGTTRLLSHPADDPSRSLAKASWPGALTPDGRILMLNSAASGVVAGVADENARDDPFAVLRGARVTTLSSAGGELQPNVSQFVAAGERAGFVVAASAGYRAWQVAGCGGELQDDVFLTGPIEEDCLVEAHFRPFHRAIYRAGPGGDLLGELLQDVFEGEDGSAVHAIAQAGQEFVGWSDGSTENPRVDRDVDASVDVVAVFAPLLDTLFADGFE